MVHLTLSGLIKPKLQKGEQTAQEVKDYYTKGYQTDVEQIIIDGKKNKVTFVFKMVKNIPTLTNTLVTKF